MIIGIRNSQRIKTMTIKVDHYLTHSQIKDILAATYNENMELVLSLMFYCGLRVTEALNIHKHTIIKDPSQVPYPRIILKGKGKKHNQFRGTTKWMQTVNFECKKSMVKSQLKLKIKDAFDNCLIGETV